MRDCSSEPQVSRCSAPPSSFVIHTHTNKGRQEVEEDDRPTDRPLAHFMGLPFFLSFSHPPHSRTSSLVSRKEKNEKVACMGVRVGCNNSAQSEENKTKCWK